MPEDEFFVIGKSHQKDKTSGSGGSTIDLSRIPHHHLPDMFPNSIDYLHQAGFLGAREVFGSNLWGGGLNLRFADGSVPGDKEHQPKRYDWHFQITCTPLA